jgi:hypothetical protein
VTTLRPAWYMDVGVEHEMEDLMFHARWVVELHAACADGPSGETTVAVLVYADPKDSSY